MLRVSDVEPFLFGHAGYWARIASVDVHVAVCGMRYHKDDGLARCEVDGQKIQLILEKTESGNISDTLIRNPGRTVRSIRQILLSKKNRYGDRLGSLVSIMEKFSDGDFYLDLWEPWIAEMALLLGVTTEIVVSNYIPTGATTMARNLDRIWQVLGSKEFEYVCGPYSRHYVKSGETFDRHPVVQVMSNPTKISMLERLARITDPALILSAYEEEPL